MRKRHLFLATLTLFFLEQVVLAGKIPIEIDTTESPYKDQPTKLVIGVSHKGNELPEILEYKIGPKGQVSIKPEEPLVIDSSNIMSILLQLYNDEEVEEGDPPPTLLAASAPFKLYEGPLVSLSVKILQSKLDVTLTYQ
jgi:hypothetical protein